MKKLYYLSTCSTCKKLMQGWKLSADIELVDIKTQAISEKEWKLMRQLAGSFEALFSKKSRNFQAQGLKASIQNDEDYGKLLPTDYTFLKRPVLVYEDQIFIGNDKANTKRVAEFLDKLGLE